mmetsp:Transcript_7161/g.11926  ORF Transcript_7161/g.11926 Transcript_7161/m.11926 type:complete len:644 (-) Transcript_7161:351-2282(-)
MGSGASSLPAHIDKDTFQRLSGGTINDAIFDSNSVDGLMTRERLIELAHMSDTYLSFERGLDSLGRNNTDRALRINAALRSRGLMTFVNEESSNDKLVQSVAAGVDKTRSLLCLLTKDYIEKVAKNIPTDKSSVEFNYNLRRKHPDNAIPIVMEPGIVNPASWNGLVGTVLSERPLVDFSNDDDFDAKIDAVFRLVTAVSKAGENLFEQLPVHTTVLSKHDKTREEQQFFQWMARATSIEEGRRIIYCSSLVKGGVTNVFALGKVCQADPQFLHKIGFSDPDADQIFVAMRDLGLGQVPLPDFSESMTMESVVFSMQKAASGAEDPRLAEAALSCVARVACSNKAMPQILNEAGMCENVLKLMKRNLGHPASMEAGCLAIYNMVNNNPQISEKFGIISGCDVVPRTIRSHLTNSVVVYHGCNAMAELALLKNNRFAFCNTGAPDVVVQAMIKNIHLADVVERCAMAANSLGISHLENVGKLGLAGACQAIGMGLDRHSEHAGVTLQLFKLIIMIAVEPSNRNQLASEQACNAYVKTIHHQINNPEVLVEACRALCCILLGSAHNRTQFGTNGACEAIKMVVERYHQHPVLAGAACSSVFALAAGSLEHKKRFNGLQPIVQNIMNNPQMSPEVRKEAKEASLRI